jgi:pentatricopeptide repeat protein
MDMFSRMLNLLKSFYIKRNVDVSSFVEWVFEEMKAAGFSPTEDMYQMRISALAMTKDGLVHKVFTDMKQTGLKPSLDMYEQVIASLGRSGETAALQKMLQEMKERGLKPDGKLLEKVVLPVLVQTGNTKEILEIITELKRAGITARLDSFHHALVGPYWKEYRPAELMNLLTMLEGQPMQVKTFKLIENNPTFRKALRIAGLARCRVKLTEVKINIETQMETAFLEPEESQSLMNVARAILIDSEIPVSLRLWILETK